MFKFKKVSIFIITLLMIFIFSACGNKAATDNSSNAETISKTIYTPIESIRTLNPLISKDEDTFFISKLLYDSLFEFDESLNLKNSLVKDYVYDDESATLKLEIVNNVMWSDGQALTAEDIVFSINAYKQALKSLETENVYKVSIDKIKSAKAIDSYNLEIEFIDKNNSALSNLTFPIMPEHQFKSVGEACTLDNKFIPIGSSKYKVVDYDIYSELVLEGNENYRGDIPKNQLHFTIIPDKNEISNLIGMDKMSLIFLDNIDREAFYSNKQVKFNDYLSNEMEVIGYNFRSEKINNKDLRKAIAYGIDNEYLKEKNYYDKAVLSDSIYYPNYLGIESKTDRYAFDFENSEKYLKAAGYTKENEEGFITNDEDEELIITLLVNSSNPIRLNAANEIKKGLEKLKIRVELLAVDWDTYKDTIHTNEYDIFIGAYKINYNYDIRFLLHSE